MVSARGEHGRRVDFSDPHRIKALAHPMRTRILGMLDERVASPRQLSDELGVPVQNVNYHVRELAKLGLIKLVRETQRRGAIDHHYQAVAAPRVSDQAWSQLPAIVRRRMTAAGLCAVFDHVNQAAAGGGFVADDVHLSRTRLTLDDKGREALVKALEATIARVDRIKEHARERLGDHHHAEQRMTLIVLCFDDVAVPTDGNPTTTNGRAQPAVQRQGEDARLGPLCR